MGLRKVISAAIAIALLASSIPALAHEDDKDHGGCHDKYGRACSCPTPYPTAKPTPTPEPTPAPSPYVDNDCQPTTYRRTVFAPVASSWATGQFVPFSGRGQITQVCYGNDQAINADDWWADSSWNIQHWPLSKYTLSVIPVQHGTGYTWSFQNDDPDGSTSNYAAILRCMTSCQ